MGQQVRSASKSYLGSKKERKKKKKTERDKKSIQRVSRLPVFAPLLRKCASGAQPANSEFPLRNRGSCVMIPARR